MSPIEVGDRSFLGNGAILGPSTRIGDDSLVGVLTTAPRASTNGTSWFGSPALELPRVPDKPDPARTTDPPTRLIAARAAMELIRILLPATVSIVLAGAMFLALASIGTAGGAVVDDGCGAPDGDLARRDRDADHGRDQMDPDRAAIAPASIRCTRSIVWRDEIVNTCQEQLAGAWLLRSAAATPIVSIYLRMQGATVGRDVWFEPLTVTEFDVAELGDGCVVNRNGVVETHLFHDRLMRIGPSKLGAGATLGPAAAMLPDTTVGEHCTIGARSVVMRGERLPARTRWQGAPVVAV